MALEMELTRDPGFWVLTLAGELDYSECSAFRMNIDRILQTAPETTVVDLSRIEYLDSSGLGLLLSLSKECNARGCMLVLVTNEVVENILSLTRLKGVFLTVRTMDDALRLLDRKTA